MKSASKMILVSVLLTMAIVVLFLIVQRYSDRHEPEGTSGSRSTSQADSSEVLINRAIEQKNPSVCEGVRKTTRPGPDDGAVILTGDDAIAWCKEQVRHGARVTGG